MSAVWYAASEWQLSEVLLPAPAPDEMAAHASCLWLLEHTSAVCREVLQPALTSSWEASGAQQELQQQQQQLDSDLTALLGELQQELQAQEGRDAQGEPEAACAPQQSMTLPNQPAMVSLLHAMHLVGPQNFAVRQMHFPNPV